GGEACRPARDRSILLAFEAGSLRRREVGRWPPLIVKRRVTVEPPYYRVAVSWRQQDWIPELPRPPAKRYRLLAAHPPSMAHFSVQPSALPVHLGNASVMESDD